MSELSAEKLLEMLKRFPAPEPDPFSLPFLRPRLAGLDVIERRAPRPKIQVRDDLEWMTPQFRAEMNAWLIARFGFEEEDRNLYRFGHYLSIPWSAGPDIRRIINTENLA